MFGPFMIGKKAAQYGYRKFGIPGAVVGGVGAVVGYRILKKRTKSVVEEEVTDADSSDAGASPEASPEEGDGGGPAAAND